jgi:hypothetical protein
MGTRWLPWAAVAAASLTGCASLQGLAGSSPCNVGVCIVQVTVGPGCAVEVSQEHLYVPRGGETHILWKIDPPAAPFVFDPNGISFPPGQNPNQLFDQKEPRDQGKVFHWRDKNDRTGQFKYVVNVRDAAGQLCSRDPFIHNQ